MNRARFAEIMALFEAACGLEPEARAGYLDDRCAGDAELRKAVEDLLRHDDASASTDDVRVGGGAEWLAQELRDASSAPSAARQDLGSAWIGKQIDRYKVVRLLGVGGMGTVFEAEQDHPSRRVALKVLSAPIFGRELIKRFEFEVQVLGRLQHPGIAGIFDAGTLGGEFGNRPYFAMELIDGEPLIGFAHSRSLPIGQRLALMVKICRAVDHAHQRGIVHRDLKPGNILVDKTGAPRVLDFGIARATDADLQLTTRQTVTGQLLGTLPYMSPEQIAGRAGGIDHRADVYALGVILFELLTNRLPFDLADRSIPESARVIAEDDPPSLGTIHRTFRGDLETIAAKALEKDANRRYTTAASMADDIDRFLNQQPIQARPAGTLYQLRKLVARHTALFVFAALLFLAVTAFAVVAALQANRIAHQRDRALAAELRATQRLEQIRQLAHSFIFDVHDVIKDLPGATEARKFITTTAAEYLDGLMAEADATDAVRRDVASAYVKIGVAHAAFSSDNLGESEAALASYHKALAILEPLYQTDPDHQQTHDALVTAYEGMGEVLLLQGRTDEAAEAYDRSLEIARHALARAPESVRARRSAMYQESNIAEIHARRGNFAEALAIFRRTSEEAERLASESPNEVRAQRDLMYVYAKIAKTLNAMGEYEDAADYTRKTLVVIEPLAAANPTNGQVLRSLAVAYVDSGDVLRMRDQDDEALDRYNQANSIREQLLQSDPSNARARMDLAASCGRLGDLHLDRGDPQQAMGYLRRSMDLRQALVRRDPHNAMYRRELSVVFEKIGNVCLSEDQITEALEHFDQSLRLRRELVEIDPGNRQTQRDLAVSLFKIGSVHASAARVPGLAADQQVEQWQSARNFFEQSLAHVRWMEVEGLARPSDAHIPDFLTEQMDQADTALAALGAQDESH